VTGAAALAMTSSSCRLRGCHGFASEGGQASVTGAAALAVTSSSCRLRGRHGFA